MNQIPSHSQMPTFVKNESNTKPVLFQHPTTSEMRRSRLAQFKADLKDFFIFIFLIALPCWLIVSFIVTLVFGG